MGWAWVRISWQKMLGAMQSNEPEGVHGERGRIRTCDPCLKRALLYQLSYAPIFYNQALAEVVCDAWEQMGTIISKTLRCASRFTGMSP